MKRRDFVRNTAALAGTAALANHAHLLDATTAAAEALPQPAVQPITDAERLARIEKARRLMRDNGIDAMVLEGGTSMYYYTGVRWGNSERTFAVVIPVKGELAWVTPAFEEARARELIPHPVDVRAWQEDESPYRLNANILRDRGATNTVGVEERLRFFIYDGVRAELPQAKFVSATPVTAGCRMIKSPAEIALMQRANDITLAAIGATIEALKPGMTNGQVSAMYGDEVRKRGEQHARATRERDAVRVVLDRVITDNFDGVVIVQDTSRQTFPVGSMRREDAPVVACTLRRRDGRRE